MLGYFGVSIIHRTLTWPAGSLTCVEWSFCMHIRHTGDLGGIGFMIVSSVGLSAVVESALTEFQWRLRSRKSQGGRKAYHTTDTHPIWWPRSIVLNFGVRERMLLLCATDSPFRSIHGFFTLGPLLIQIHVECLWPFLYQWTTQCCFFFFYPESFPSSAHNRHTRWG